ncbi:hypothetical protein [Nocardia farcinica]|uniref:hypothetical protein n=1 Tax=Nocardia farcinica TaxID=37329 RepID=UPI00245426EB|nr:hypothetical protein [Nocardia farcinica]
MVILYMANPCSEGAVAAMEAGVIGFIDTPAQGNRRPAGVKWCADNGCYSGGYPGDIAWLGWLAKNAHAAKSCLFATAPDVVGDAAATLTRSAPFLPIIRALGYKAALVAQDGLESLHVPWGAFDALFVGGSTEWKLGPQARVLVTEARRRSKWVHMGRVNSERRCRYAELIGCDSVDGTYLKFGPDINLPKLLGWADRMSDAPSLVYEFTEGAA